ncbi:hypothetical protein MIR68_003985 [Amoeboaphelidium protococcarum]|nr:hypothetical protein MIR68_003985 [Amoeboaphelidium protococcarum]
MVKRRRCSVTPSWTRFFALQKQKEASQNGTGRLTERQQLALLKNQENILTNSDLQLNDGKLKKSNKKRKLSVMSEAVIPKQHSEIGLSFQTSPNKALAERTVFSSSPLTDTSSKLELSDRADDEIVETLTLDYAPNQEAEEVLVSEKCLKRVSSLQKQTEHVVFRSSEQDISLRPHVQQVQQLWPGQSQVHSSLLRQLNGQADKFLLQFDKPTFKLCIDQSILGSLLSDRPTDYFDKLDSQMQLLNKVLLDFKIECVQKTRRVLLRIQHEWKSVVSSFDVNGAANSRLETVLRLKASRLILQRYHDIRKIVDDLMEELALKLYMLFDGLILTMYSLITSEYRESNDQIITLEQEAVLGRYNTVIVIPSREEMLDKQARFTTKIELTDGTIVYELSVLQALIAAVRPRCKTLSELVEYILKQVRPNLGFLCQIV